MVTHPFAMRGLTPDGAPSILERRDPDFLPGVLDDIASLGVEETLRRGQPRAKNGDGSYRLFQPIQQTFNLAFFELICDPFQQVGLQPRVDPKRIESASMVVRRQVVRNGQAAPGAYEGWRTGDGPMGLGPVAGWMPFGDGGAPVLDPDPARRPAMSAGHPEIDRLLAQLDAADRSRVRPTMAYEETVVPLFVAPPDVCEKAGKTILYGLIPVTSADSTQGAAPDRPVPDDVLAKLIPWFLRVGGPRAAPRAGQVLRYANGLDKGLADFMDALRLLRLVLNAFGDTPEATILFGEINKITLPMPGGGSRQAGDFLKEAADVLSTPPDPAVGGAPAITMPTLFPAISSDQATAIRAKAALALDANVATTAPGLNRFDGTERRYIVRGFARLRDEEGCPPVLVTSVNSASFSIAPWYEGSGQPPVRVSLPDLHDRKALQSLKPNVAFEMPESLFGLMQGTSMEKLMGGDGSGGSGMGIGWLCSFSIPIITLCAFIVLNIFLSLLNIVFNWMMYLKICLPYPKPR